MDRVEPPSKPERVSKRSANEAAVVRRPMAGGALVGIGCATLVFAAGACSVEDTVATILGQCAVPGDCPGGRTCENGRCESAADSGRAECERPTVTSLCPPRRDGFELGVCVCEDLVTRDRVTVDRIDARSTSGDVPREWGSLGVNEGINANGPLSVSGSVWAAGGGGITINAPGVFEAGEALHDQGVLMGAVSVSVGSDAEIGGNVSVERLVVAGTLRVPEGVSVEVAGEESVGARAIGTVTVPAPCPMGDDAALPVAAAVAERRLDNDNAAIGLDAFELDGFDGERRIELPCGRYHWARLAGANAVELMVSGHVAVYIDGEVALDDAFRLRLEEGATIDLFVEGDFRVNGPLELGSEADAGRVRVFIGGSGTVLLGDDSTIAGPLYATDAALVAQRSLEIFGGLVVRRAAPEGPLVVHHDAALTELWTECE